MNRKTITFHPEDAMDALAILTEAGIEFEDVDRGTDGHTISVPADRHAESLVILSLKNKTTPGDT